jgi:SAM-dependent methyltransferase
MTMSPIAPKAHPSQQADARTGQETSQHHLRMMRLITGHWIAQTVRAAAELSIADHLADGPLRAEQIAEREASDPEATYRLLRACVGLDLVTSDDQDRFASTPLLALLRATVRGSLRATALAMAAPEQWLPWARFPDAVRAGGSKMAASLGMSTFDYYAEHRAEAELFTDAMASSAAVAVDELAALVDVSTNGSGLVVDLGGADGAFLHALLHRHSRLRGVVLELPSAIAGAVAEAARQGLADRVTAVAGDFFTSVPAAEIYLLKLVLRDWNDDMCVRLLRTCRRAMKPGARLVVVDCVLGTAGEPDSAALLDIGLLSVLPAQERGLAEFDALFAAARLRRRSAIATHGGLQVIEAMPVN